MRKNAAASGRYSNVSYVYNGSDADVWCTNTYLNKLNVKDIIIDARIPYYDYVEDTADQIAYMTRKCFILSAGELVNPGWGADGYPLAYWNNTAKYTNFVAKNDDNQTVEWWLRSPAEGATSIDHYDIQCISIDGEPDITSGPTRNLYYRPAFIVPLDTQIDSSNNIIA